MELPGALVMSHHWRDYVTGAYRAERAAQDARAEQYASAYDSDTRDYFDRIETRITFADILISARGYARHTWESETA